MRKIATFLFIVLIHWATYSMEIDKPVVVAGTWDRTGTKEVVLYQIVSGRLEPLSTYVLQEDDHSFGFAFIVRKEGFYVIGSGHPLTQQDKYTFYFKPGDALSFAVNDTSYTLTGANTIENRSMERWEQYIHPMRFNAVYFHKVFITVCIIVVVYNNR